MARSPAFLRALVTALLLAAAGAAHAGRSCDEQTLSVATLQRGLDLAERTRAALEQAHARDGTRVVVLARAGQDLTRYGLRWSHLGYAYRDEAQGEPVWRVLHKLNRCGTAEAAIYRQGLGQFFLDDLWRHEAAWVVPTPALQERLLPALRDDRVALRMHVPAYSMVAYAWGMRYQQSNQWALETLVAAQLPPTSTRAQAQALLVVQGYEPTTLALGAFTRLGGRMTRANVAFDDHPNEKRFSDRIETVTVDSVFSWLVRTGQAGAPVSLVQP